MGAGGRRGWRGGKGGVKNDREGDWGRGGARVGEREGSGRRGERKGEGRVRRGNNELDGGWGGGGKGV